MRLGVRAALAAGDQCVNGFPDMNLITALASQPTGAGEKLKNGLSLLNAFTCSGTLTGLVLGVDVRTETDNRDEYPEISLWRPEDPLSQNTAYSVVTGSERQVMLTPDNFNTSGVFEYALDDAPLNFQANDILGWTQPDDPKSVVRMYQVSGEASMITRPVPKGKVSTTFTLKPPKDFEDNVLLLYPIVGTGKH